jgi:formyltetrahydrofolate hydrolase
LPRFHGRSRHQARCTIGSDQRHHAILKCQQFRHCLPRLLPRGAIQHAAREFEEQVDQVVANDPRLQQLVEQLEQAADDDHMDESDLPTGDDLVAELERFLRERGDTPPPASL